MCPRRRGDGRADGGREAGGATSGLGGRAAGDGFDGFAVDSCTFPRTVRDATTASVMPSLGAWLLVPPPSVPASESERRAVALARGLVAQADDARRDDAQGVLGLAPAAAAPAAALASLRVALSLCLGGVPAGEGASAIALVDALETPAGASFCAAHPALRAVVLRPAADDLALSASALDADVDALAAALEALLRGREPATWTPGARWIVRVRRLALTLGLAALVGLGLSQVAVSLRTDLAANAPWQASSASEGYAERGQGFHPVEGRFNIFFQTGVEAEPWVRFDLGAPRTVRVVRVQNRLDSRQEWAVPLVVEASDDGTHWRALGRRVEPFYFWQLRVQPTTARWIRLRVARPTSLHLGRVEIR